ncbi:MAG: hypothetical protein ABIR37_02695 [Candidatus Saccharimonadales bacterium]
MNPSAPNQPDPFQGGAAPGSPRPAAMPPETPYGAVPQLPQAAPFAAPPQNMQAPNTATGPLQPGFVSPSAPPPATGMPAAAPPVVTNPNSTQNALQIAEIRDGIVIMNDGSYRAVVMIKSINFDLMSPQEQEAVEYSYQGFLNSLYFPLQIFIRSNRVDLQPYIEKLDKIRTEHDNMLLALLMEDYINYIDALSQQTNIMDKKFYIVVPYFPTVDVQKALTQSKNFFSGIGQLFNSKEQHVVINEAELEQAKSELRNRVQAVLAGLLQCSIQGLPLDTQELIELYYDTYNPDTATRQQLKNFDDLNADVITKGAGAAPQAHLQRELQ